MAGLVANGAAFVLLLCTLTGVFRWFVTGVPPRLLRRPVERFEAYREARRPKPPPLPPILLGMELRRIAEDLRRIEAGNQPNKAERLASCTLAYDYVLRDYCRALDLPEPGGVAGLSKMQRFEMETRLIGAGHGW
ncbi:hypothetical protein BN12_1150028 [Nostocoides japonicum T1-X7]|uniref:Uncharacterized protein n=1 Tax=Nostocoides japonicum T1-X7 TaxID=1194083 RepID=A0A077LWD8_9MICO|nr:hypothetical protein [Tetrasphaera japonica]CCH76235.1 hypothetical protein BN12_1150028 [Tetrasphaera japonica T1-X7]